MGGLPSGSAISSYSESCLAGLRADTEPRPDGASPTTCVPLRGGVATLPSSGTHQPSTTPRGWAGWKPPEKRDERRRNVALDGPWQVTCFRLRARGWCWLLTIGGMGPWHVWCTCEAHEALGVALRRQHASGGERDLPRPESTNHEDGMASDSVQETLTRRSQIFPYSWETEAGVRQIQSKRILKATGHSPGYSDSSSVCEGSSPCTFVM